MSKQTESTESTAVEPIAFPEGRMITPTSGLRIGEQDATVVFAELSASTKGTPCIKLRLDLGYTRQNHMLFWTESSMESTQKQLTRTFQTKPLEGMDADEILEELQQLVGKECSVNVQNVTKPDGTQRVEIRWVNPRRVVITDKTQIASIFAKRAPKEEIPFE
jgi:hypothetical protein